MDGFGVGTALDTSSDAPVLDAVYKIQSYAGVARRKRSEGKATWPGTKQVWREMASDGTMRRDRLQLMNETGVGQVLLQPAMRWCRVAAPISLEQIRAHHAAQMRTLPRALRVLETAVPPRTRSRCPNAVRAGARG